MCAIKCLLMCCRGSGIVWGHVLERIECFSNDITPSPELEVADYGRPDYQISLWGQPSTTSLHCEVSVL